jgi:hypothetical protein
MHEAASRTPRDEVSAGARAGILGETQIFLTQLPIHTPTGPGGRTIHYSTALRWVVRGVRGVKLDAIRLGGRWVTSLEALNRFATKLTKAGDADPTPTGDRPPDTDSSAPGSSESPVGGPMSQHRRSG